MIKLKLFSLENVSISSSRLSWSRGDTSKNDSFRKLLKNLGILWVGLSEFGLDIIRSSGSSPVLNVEVELLGLLVRLDSEVFLDEEILERSSIDFNDGVLDKGVGSDEFRIRWMESNRDDFGLVDSSLRLPNEVSSIESKSSVLMVTSSNSNLSDSFFADFGGSHWSSFLVSSFLLVDWHNSSGVSSFVSRISTNSHLVLVYKFYFYNFEPEFA